MNTSQHSIQRPPTSGVPVGMRPPSRTTNDQKVVSSVPKVNILNRPTTVNGLPSANTKTSERKVADKSYFIGILRNKINEIMREIEHLQTEIDKRKRDHSIQTNLEQSVSCLKNEITQRENELADYNVLSDYVQNGTHVDDIIEEFKAIEISNLKCEDEVNKSFKEKKDLEKIVSELEKNVHDMMSQKQIPELKAMNKEIELLELKCSELKKAKTTVNLNGKSREELLQMVKETTKNIGDTEKMIKDEQKTLFYIQNQIKNLTDKENDLDTERGKKYLKLLQKEKEMNTFIQNFQDNVLTTQKEISNSQDHIYNTLVNISNEIKNIDDLPTTSYYKQLQNELAYKEKQIILATTTIQNLQIEVENRRKVLQHLNEADIKMQNEIENIKKSIKKMEDELPNFENVDVIKHEGEILIRNKSAERDQLKSQLLHLRKITNVLASKYNDVNRKIKNDEINIKLCSLEKGIREKSTEKNAIKEIIDENKRITNYSIVKRDALKIVQEINNLL